MIKYFLILFSLFLTLFFTDSKGTSYTYGDFLLFFLAPFFINDLLKSRLEIDKISKAFFYFIIIIIVSSIVNFTFFEGAFLNILRTYTFSLLIYVWLLNDLKKNKISKKMFQIGIWLFAFVFLAKTWPEMQQSFAEHEEGFTTVNVFKSSLNLNTWGYILVLLLIYALYCWYSQNRSIKNLFFILVLIFFIFFSFSRASYILTLLIFLISWYKQYSLNIKKITFYAIIIISISFLALQFNFINLNETSLLFLEKKTDTSIAQNNFLYMRVYINNIKPIIDNILDFNLLQYFFGDGLSVQHSIVSHTIVVSGFLGLLFYIKYVRTVIILGFKNSRINKKENFFLSLTISIVVLNDFATNVSSFLPIASYLSFMLLAFFKSHEVNLKNN